MSSLQVSDAFCYICRGILIEPVTLPCAHVFCLICFEQSMQETSHSCPLCRKRISNWIRSVKKSNKLIDVKLWEKIKEQFKEQVRLKLNGEDDGLDHFIQNECAVQMPVSKSGEVAQEFSKLLSHFRQEREKLKEAEELASKELIEKLRIQEEEQLEKFKEKNLKRIKQDERLARMIQKEIQEEISENNCAENKKKSKTREQKSTTKGPMDEFLKNLTSLNADRRTRRVSSSRESGSDKEASTDSVDSFRMEYNLFKPIKKALRTPPKRYPDGRFREINLTKVTPVKLILDETTKPSSELNLVEGKRIRSDRSAFVDAVTSWKRSEDSSVESPHKRLKFSKEDTDVDILKDITLGENADAHSTTSSREDRGEELGRKKLEAPLIRLDFLFPPVGKSHSSKGKEDGENDLFETQDYLNPSPTLEEKLIEEQRRIEQIILQEKKDRELALRLSREWQRETETRRKPQTRSMIAQAIKMKKGNLKNVRLQKTLTESGSLNARKSRRNV